MSKTLLPLITVSLDLLEVPRVLGDVGCHLIELNQATYIVCIFFSKCVTIVCNDQKLELWLKLETIIRFWRFMLEEYDDEWWTYMYQMIKLSKSRII